MRIFVLMTALVCFLLVPALAAEAPEATAKRIKTLENASQVLREDLANTKLELDTAKEDTQKAIDAEAKARKDLETKVNKLADALTAEVKARGESDKMIAELQNELTNQKLRADSLQAALDQAKKDQALAAAELAALLDKNTTQDKKDRTITYVLSVLLGGLAISK